MKRISINNKNETMILIEYISYRNVTILFPDTNTIVRNREYSKFLKGQITNPEYPTVCGVGYIGIGEYKSHDGSKVTPQYQCWNDMLKRVYGNREHCKRYVDCSVCDEWLNFQNFARWYDENYYVVEGERTELDKDILVKNNRIYSPDTCVFVPRTINILFTKNNAKRGKFPIGISASGDNFRVRCGSKYLGSFNDIDSAFNAYKIEKERMLKETAEKYKDAIPKILYDALYKYKVEIDD